MAGKTKKTLRDLVDAMSERQKEEIFKTMREQSAAFHTGHLYPSVGARRGFSVDIPRSKGSTELLSPEGKVLMRDGEIVEQNDNFVTIRYGAFAKEK